MKNEAVVISRDEKRVAFQGDTMLRRCTALPEGARRLEGPESNVVAHSETGHHHIVEGGEVFVIPSEPLSLYVKATSNDVSFKHLRAWDTHQTINFKAEIGDVISVRLQREMTPVGWQRALD